MMLMYNIINILLYLYIIKIIDSSSVVVHRKDYKIAILMIGSVNRTEFIDVQRPYLESVNGIDFKIYDEAMVPSCVLCNSSSSYTNYSFIHRPHGWWCAQKRTILALEDYLYHYDVPDFMLIVDDDTFVNIINLKNYINTLKVTDKHYIGQEMNGPGRGYRIIGGCGGALISRPVLQKLKPGISQCVSHAQGGKWCHYHSDWVVAACIEDLAKAKAKMSYLFRQYVRTPKDCLQSYVACHGFKNSFDLGQIYIMHGIESDSKMNVEVDLSSGARVGLLQNCHFYVPINYKKWPRSSHYFDEYNKSNSDVHGDYHSNTHKLIDMFYHKYTDQNMTKFRVLYGDINYCSKCFPVITKSRPVGCGLNMISWIHYSRHFETLNHRGVNMLRKVDMPYLQKHDIAVWRGTTTGVWTNESDILDRMMMMNNPSFTRQIFVSKYFDSPDPIDIGLAHCGGQTASKCQYYNKYVKGDKTIKEMLQNKFLISLEGNDVATGLKWMLASNSVVFMPAPGRESWVLESHLKPWVHYVPLLMDGSDLMEKIMHAKANPDQMMNIIKNAKQYINKFLNFYSQEEQAVEELKFYVERVHIMPSNTKPSVKCDRNLNSTWLYYQLKDCNLQFY